MANDSLQKKRDSKHQVGRMESLLGETLFHKTE